MVRGDVPPLEIRPIFQSGDPKNRVDLVFFGDGCEFLIVFVMRCKVQVGA